MKWSTADVNMEIRKNLIKSYHKLRIQTGYGHKINAQKSIAFMHPNNQKI